MPMYMNKSQASRYFGISRTTVGKLVKCIEANTDRYGEYAILNGRVHRLALADALKGGTTNEGNIGNKLITCDLDA